MRRFAQQCAVFIALVVAPLAWGQGDELVTPEDLWKHVTVYRDAWGVPYVRADSLGAMAFGFGYAQAEDRIEAVLKAYRVVNGRAAEVWGEEFADSDAFALQMSHATLAEEAFRQADPLIRDLCAGFALGVNSWLAANAGQAPSWAEGVKPHDVLALLHAYLMSFAPFDLKDVYHRPPAAVSGNSWAIAPGRSADGSTMLVMSALTDYEGPFQWCEAQLSAPGYTVSGGTLCGLPVLLMGHNGALGWALTPNQADTGDIYLESPPGTGQGGIEALEAQYYLRLSAQPKSYYVRTGNALQRRAVDTMDAGRGPVVGMNEGRFCSYRIGGYRDFGALGQLVEMGRATDLGAFREALALQQLPCFHVLYADRAGNIFYLYNAKVGRKAWSPPEVPPAASEGTDAAKATPSPPPQKPKIITDWSAPVPGNEPFFEWGDTVPMDLLPTVTNPPSGYLQGCGAPPWLATERSGLKAEQWPLWLVTDRDTYRAQRVRLLLRSPGQTFDAAQGLLFDTQVPFAAQASRFLLNAKTALPEVYNALHPDGVNGLEAIRTWDGAATTSSTAMAFYTTWWTTLRRMAPEFATEGGLMQAIASGVEALRAPALRAASEAGSAMRNEFQNAAVPWGDVHVLRRGTREVPFPGTDVGDPIFVASNRVFEEKRWRVTYGYAFAMAVRFGDTPETRSLLPFGVSDRADSPHYADQLDLLLARRLKPVPFESSDVLSAAEQAHGRIALLRPRGGLGLVRVESPGPVIDARIRTLFNAPAPLPDGFAAYSAYVSVACTPETPGLNVAVELEAPAPLCAAEHVGQLNVYALGPDHGWTPLPRETVEGNPLAVRVRDTQARTYVLAGPAQYRIAHAAPAPLTIPEPPKIVVLAPPDDELVGMPVDAAAPTPPVAPAPKSAPEPAPSPAPAPAPESTPEPAPEPTPPPAPAPMAPELLDPVAPVPEADLSPNAP